MLRDSLENFPVYVIGSMLFTWNFPLLEFDLFVLLLLISNFPAISAIVLFWNQLFLSCSWWNGPWCSSCCFLLHKPFNSCIWTSNILCGNMLKDTIFSCLWLWFILGSVYQLLQYFLWCSCKSSADLHDFLKTLLTHFLFLQQLWPLHLLQSTHSRWSLHSMVTPKETKRTNTLPLLFILQQECL